MVVDSILSRMGFGARRRLLRGMSALMACCNVLIVLNAVAFGMLTYPDIADRWGTGLEQFCDVSIYVFLVELGLRVSVYGRRFFNGRDAAWNWMDAILIVGSYLATTGYMASFRIFRLLRLFRELNLLRMLKMSGRLRLILSAMAKALPGIMTAGSCFVIVLYIFALLMTELFGAEHAGYFGTVGMSMFTMFQIMTLSGWEEVARDVMSDHPWTWIIFVFYVIVSSYIIFNMVTAILVEGLQSEYDREERRRESAAAQADREASIRERAEQAEMARDLKELRRQMDELTRRLDSRQP